MAITQYYVDPAINGNSGSGTSGDPYGDLQWALDHITRNATDGDQINIKAGTNEVLAAALSLTTYGAPNGTAPLILRGYTTTANDGGIGVISGNGSVAVLAGSGNDYVNLIDLRLTNCGGNNVVVLRNYCSVTSCEIDTNSGGIASLVNITGVSHILGCYVHDGTSNGISMSGGGAVIGNYVTGCGTSSAQYQINVSNPGLKVVAFNVVKPPTGVSGITLDAAGAVCFGNTVYNSSGTGTGLNLPNAIPARVLFNNIVEGFSGGGGKGIAFDAGAVMHLYHSNALYNNTTGVSGTPKWAGYTGNNDTLGSAPFVDAANGDFDLNGTIAGVTEDGWPSMFPGATSTTPKIDKGASQAGAGAGGGGPLIGGRLVRG